MKVVIAGGGFSGSMVARGLGTRTGVEVTLINADNFLLFTPMLAEVAVGDVDPRHIVAPFQSSIPDAQPFQVKLRSVSGERKVSAS